MVKNAEPSPELASENYNVEINVNNSHKDN